ncbi:unnamed protein product [Protopolystoma xenopodis]|uniref:DNA-directed RNA polymerase N-terminal domain-containing protein n=1 Tax=Protopolystoma xenopodis TaxID=117903 RepID=A0A3S5B8K4_9PLAT|nr:unnamed protein product [Protopolystoma xenopodis]
MGNCAEHICRLNRRRIDGLDDEMARVYADFSRLFIHLPLSSKQTITDNPSVLSSHNGHRPPDLPQHPRQQWRVAQLAGLMRGPSLHQDWPVWGSSITFMVGQQLYNLLYNRLTFKRSRVQSLMLKRPHGQPQPNLKTTNSISDDSSEVPLVFEVLTEDSNVIMKQLKVHPLIIKWYHDAGATRLSFQPTELPMLCPPLPWVDLSDAGYLLSTSKTDFLSEGFITSPLSLIL